MANLGSLDRKASSETKSGLASIAQDPSSPHTPIRAIPSTVSSPSLGYRTEEEPLVFEFGARCFRAGFAGEASPRCTLGFGPESSRRVGDYRAWLPDGDERLAKRKRTESWGKDHELWSMNLRDIDLDLVEDKIERVVREVYTRHLLMDYKAAKKMILVLPSVIPHRLLNTVLSCLFINPPSPPNITLLSSPMLNVLAAGCRSGLVVDIGWRETVMTAIYEYREVGQWRTTRAMRMVTMEFAKALEQEACRSGQSSPSRTDASVPSSQVVSLDKAEDVVVRLGWCPNWHDANRESPEVVPMTIPSPISPKQNLVVPFSTFSRPIEHALLVEDEQRALDDQEQSVHLLMYRSLVALPPDVRSVCMSRIVITGGGSNIPGVKNRLLDELKALVDERGWDPVFGRVPDKNRKHLKEISDNIRSQRQEKASNAGIAANGSRDVPAYAQELGPDFFEEKYGRSQRKGTEPVVSGEIRGIETLGAWAGGSLLASLRIKGVVEIEKEVFLQYGLAGARRDAADSNVGPLKALGPSAPKAGDRTTWTLGAWA